MWAWLGGARGWAGLWGAGAQACCASLGQGLMAPGADVGSWAVCRWRSPGGLGSTCKARRCPQGPGRAAAGSGVREGQIPELQWVCGWKAGAKQQWRRRRAFSPVSFFRWAVARGERELSQGLGLGFEGESPELHRAWCCKITERAAKRLLPQQFTEEFG